MSHFLDHNEPVIALIGSVIPDDSGDGDVLLLEEQDRAVRVPGELGEFLAYVTAPRSMTEVASWIHAAIGSEPDIERLVRSGRVLLVTPGSASETLKAFTGLRAVPLGFRVDVPGASGKVAYIGPEEGSTQVRPVSALLGDALWGQSAGEDLPSTAARLAEGTDLNPDQVGRLALSGLDALLALGLARLESVTSRGPAPEQARVLSSPRADWRSRLRSLRGRGSGERLL